MDIATQQRDVNIKLSTQGIKFQNNTCAACSDDLDTNKIIAFRCGHEFHYECIVTDEEEENKKIFCSICKNDRNDILSNYKKHQDNNVKSLGDFEKDMNDVEGNDQILKLSEWVQKDMWQPTRYYQK